MFQTAMAAAQRQGQDGHGDTEVEEVARQLVGLDVSDISSPPSHKPQPCDVAVTPQPRDVAVTPQPRDVAVTPQPRDVAVTPQPRDVGVRPQPRDVGVRPQPRDVGVRPQPRDVSTRPQARPVNTADHRFVYFDLETTGLELTCHITQIAAHSGEETFSRFVLPKKAISEGAQQVTGITCVGQQMYHHGQEVVSLSITHALDDFITFLGKEPVVLIGHNIKNFDCPRLLIALQACGLVEGFRRMVHGFVDTLPLFRELCPQAENHRQPTLYRHFLGQDYLAHDAREDVKALQQVVDRARPGHDAFTHHSFTLEHIIECQCYKAARDRLRAAWMVLVREGRISQYIADKASDNGLGWEEIRHTFLTDGEGAVRRLLTERLTNVQRIIDSIIQKLQSGGC
ncbi:uncharacterized protein LOC143289707 isoform X2 [Babylonia areolata]|uniref:uncharacterized protein LOC143289707 isoform X2 n=1 Tax=Babylonia areolata TaxID=304850 RepID=UPI003FD536D3